jgi:putative PIG3 family NAD(P)H quinone oxidoreductase
MGRYPAPAGSPADIPGLEYSGEVDAVGTDVTMWRPGDRVMGIVGGGAHAEFLTAHQLEVMRMPPGMSFEDGAAIPEVFLTAYDAMFAQLKMIAGESLLIHAVGSGVGTAAVQMARVSGIRTIGTSRSHDKLESARDLGLDESILGTDTDWAGQVLALTGNKGVDCVLDLVGAAYLQGNLECLGLKGRLVSVGLTAGASAALDMRTMMRKRITIIGTVLRSRSHEEKAQLVEEFASQMLPSFASGDVVPIVDSVLSFNDIREAHERMESNATFGKIVLVWR